MSRVISLFAGFVFLLGYLNPAEAAGEKFWIRIGGSLNSTNIELVEDPGIDPTLSGYGVELDFGAEFPRSLRIGAGALGRAPRSFNNPETGSVSVFGLAEYLWKPLSNYHWGVGGSIGQTWFFGSPKMRSELEQRSGGPLVPDTRGVRGTSPMLRAEVFFIRNLLHWLGIRVSAGYLYSNIDDLVDTEGVVITTPSGNSFSADLSSWIISISFDVITVIQDPE